MVDFTTVTESFQAISEAGNRIGTEFSKLQNLPAVDSGNAFLAALRAMEDKLISTINTRFNELSTRLLAT